MSEEAGKARAKVQRLGVVAAAEHVGITTSYLYKAIQTGKLTATRDENGGFVVDVADLELLTAALESGVGPGEAAKRARMS